MILSFFFIILPDMFSPTMVNGTDQNIRGTVTITTWQYHIAAIGIFITWIINMLMVGIGSSKKALMSAWCRET